MLVSASLPAWRYISWPVCLQIGKANPCAIRIIAVGAKRQQSQVLSVAAVPAARNPENQGHLCCKVWKRYRFSISIAMDWHYFLCKIWRWVNAGWIPVQQLNFHDLNPAQLKTGWSFYLQHFPPYLGGWSQLTSNDDLLVGSTSQTVTDLSFPGQERVDNMERPHFWSWSSSDQWFTVKFNVNKP